MSNVSCQCPNAACAAAPHRGNAQCTSFSQSLFNGGPKAPAGWSDVPGKPLAFRCGACTQANP